MATYGTMERSWYGVTPSGYPIRVEEHRYDLSYIVEFYDGDEISGDLPLSHCPISGEELTTDILSEANPEIALALGE